MATQDSNESPQLKQCLSGDGCLHDDGPSLPLSEFYKAAGTKDRRQSRCKKCHKAQIGKNKPKQEPGHSTEGLVIQELRKRSIYAAPGKASEWRWVDITAWGCCRIECKSATKDEHGRYLFKFDNQRRKGIQADLVVLICIDGDTRTFHVFPANHSAFFTDGRVKNGVQYDPLQTNRKNGWGERLTASLMTRYQDAWEQVEDVRLKVAAQLAIGEWEPERVGKPEPRMKQLL